MMVLVSYDVSTRDDAGKRRLRRVARLCEDRGQRVQNSVFECLVDAAQWVAFRASLLAEADPAADSLRFYFLGNEWHRRVEHIGAKVAYDPEGPPHSVARWAKQHRANPKHTRRTRDIRARHKPCGYIDLPSSTDPSKPKDHSYATTPHLWQANYSRMLHIRHPASPPSRGRGLKRSGR